MKLPHVIAKKIYKNYLRVYANIDLAEYSIQSKTNIIDQFVNLSRSVFAPNNLKYDIGGKRIGLSKGAPFLGKRGFDNRLKKFGYQDIDSVITVLEKSNKMSHISFLQKIKSRPFLCEITFTWDYDTENNIETSINIFKELSKIVSIEYGYSYLATVNMSVIGGFRTNIVGVSSVPKTEQIWNDKISSIKDGAIKKMYPLNCFNKNQLKLLSQNFDKTISIDNERLAICIL